LFSNNPKRPNIYSESAWPGSGFYGGSWTQPLNISWESLQNSISMSMSAGINGINNWVTEICGIESFQNGILTDDQIEICTRWAEITAYLPMVRIKGDLSEYIVYNN
jgi:alpha-glucosidase (family GH31 glycosyl hydrolase)